MKPQTTNTMPCEYVPTCTDGFKNGKETGPDCGGDCGPCTGNEKEKTAEEKAADAANSAKGKRNSITGAVVGVGASEIKDSIFSNPLKIGGIVVVLVASILGYLVLSKPKHPGSSGSAGNTGNTGTQ